MGTATTCDLCGKVIQNPNLNWGMIDMGGECQTWPKKDDLTTADICKNCCFVIAGAAQILEGVTLDFTPIYRHAGYIKKGGAWTKK